MMVSPGLRKARRRPVGRGTAVRLHVGGIGAEDLLEAVDRELLDDVDVLAAAVVALAGVAFGVLVGQLAALGGHDGGRGVVLARDQLDVVFLAGVLGLDGGKDRGRFVRSGCCGRTWQSLK